jgi:hypothetical protein
MDEPIMLTQKTVQAGDVFQILTSEDICYGQVTHTHPEWKFVIAIFREFFSAPPEYLSVVIAKQPQFVTTFLIQDAVRQGLFALIANLPVPERLRQFPIFRSTENSKDGHAMWFF